MTVTEIITLLQAGYTKAEIEALDSSSFSPTPSAPEKPAGTPDPAPAQAAPAESEESPAAAPEAPAVNPQAEAFLASFNASIQKMQSIVDKAARTANMPTIEGTAPRTLSDIVTDFFKEE